MAHAPALHEGVPFTDEQPAPHALQLSTSLLRLTSQPSAALLLQSANPALQAMAQTPLLHEGVPFTDEQAAPQALQLPTSLLRLTSHPSAALPLQSANPA